MAENGGIVGLGDLHPSGEYVVEPLTPALRVAK